jgi:sugar lactone lactonase YvrE
MHVLQRLSPRGRPEATWGNQVSDTFSRPRGIAVDRSGVMYLGDTNDSAVKKLAPSGLTVAAWKTAGYPQAVALDRAGKVYVSSVKGATSTLQVISSDGSVLCQWPLPGRAGSTLGSGPGSLTVDSAGDVYVAELDAMRVVKFSADGAVLATWQEQPGAPIQDYLHPTALTLDAHDDLWVAFTVPDRIVEYSPRGSELTSWPLPLLHRGAVSDPATGLTFDPAGHLWAVAPEEVMELSTGGQVLRSWSKWGTTPGTFISPSGIASDAVGAIYVVDSWNDWVQKLTT